MIMVPDEVEQIVLVRVGSLSHVKPDRAASELWTLSDVTFNTILVAQHFRCSAAAVTI